MKKMYKRLKVLVFLLGLAGIWIAAENILRSPKSADLNIMGMKNVRESKDYYDILISGTSMSMMNISTAELYAQYGIAGISIGEPNQMTFLSYYSIEEALKTQSPEVVLFDVQALFYSRDLQKRYIKEDEQYYVHDTLDNLSNSRTKYEAVTQVKELHPSTSYWDYFSQMYHSHSNWEDLKKGNFVPEQIDRIISGSIILTDIQENTQNDKEAYLEENTNEKVDISEINKEYVRKMAELCKENGVNLVLIRSCGDKNWSWGQYNAVKELADELGLDYLDLAVYEKQLGFDWRVDTFDGNHQNVSGTKKWTDFLGEYLTENYNFEDRRGNTAYQKYEDEKPKYENAVTAINRKISLLKALNLNQYLDTLLNMEKEGTVILISAEGGAGSCLSDTSQNFLTALGGNINLKDYEEYGYYLVLDDGKMIEEDKNQNKCKTKGTMEDGTTFRIASAGTDSSAESSIKINDDEKIQGGQGMNIVVYNKATEEVLSSVFFDTHNEENPVTSRIGVSGNVEQETDVNYWQAE